MQETTSTAGPRRAGCDDSHSTKDESEIAQALITVMRSCTNSESELHILPTACGASHFKAKGLKHASALYSPLGIALSRRRRTMRLNFIQQCLEGAIHTDGSLDPKTLLKPEFTAVMITPYWLGDYCVKIINMDEVLKRFDIVRLLEHEIALQKTLPLIEAKGYRDVHIALPVLQGSAAELNLHVVISCNDRGEWLTTIHSNGLWQQQFPGTKAAQAAAAFAHLCYARGHQCVVDVRTEVHLQAVYATAIARTSPTKFEVIETAGRNTLSPLEGEHTDPMSELCTMLSAQYDSLTLQRSNTDPDVHKAMVGLFETQMVVYTGVMCSRVGTRSQPPSDPGLQVWMERQTRSPGSIEFFWR